MVTANSFPMEVGKVVHTPRPGDCSPRLPVQSIAPRVPAPCCAAMLCDVAVAVAVAVACTWVLARDGLAWGCGASY